jgi:hypothetical protein
MIKSTRPGMGIPKASLGAIYLKLAKGFPSTGEYLYVPDISTLRICPYAPKHAVVMGWFQEKMFYLNAKNELTIDVPLCPRATLLRTVRSGYLYSASQHAQNVLGKQLPGELTSLSVSNQSSSC